MFPNWSESKKSNKLRRGKKKGKIVPEPDQQLSMFTKWISQFLSEDRATKYYFKNSDPFKNSVTMQSPTFMSKEGLLVYMQEWYEQNGNICSVFNKDSKKEKDI